MPLGLIGQLVWNIENQWFNTFVYAKIAKDPTIISWMVAVSAIATTISTFVFGTLSDRKGRRKTFIGFGYILWGIFTILGRPRPPARLDSQPRRDPLKSFIVRNQPITKTGGLP